MSTIPEDDQTIEMLARQIGALPSLQDDEISNLFAGAIASPRGQAAVRLAEHHLGDTLDAALTFRNQGVPVAELFQEAGLALTAAVNEYVASGNPPAGLQRHIKRALDAHLQAVVREAAAACERHVAAVKAAELLEAAEVTLRNELGRSVTPVELAQALKWPVARVSETQLLLDVGRETWDEDITQYLDDVPDENPE